MPGFTNRVLGRFVDMVFCSFPGTETQFPASASAHHRQSGPEARDVAARASHARDPFTVFIFGGSQGALGHQYDGAGFAGWARETSRAELTKFVHQTWRGGFTSACSEGYRKAGIPARVEKFIHEMPQAYAESSLLICRAGASTLAEIAAVGRASVLVPLPTASDNHQEKNARVFSEVGAAELLSCRGLEGGRAACAA